MLRPISSPLGARDLNFLANLKILSYGLTLKVTSPPILTRSFDAQTYTLTTYWWNRTFMKEGIFSQWSTEKSRSFFFLKKLELEWAPFKNGEQAPILGMWAGVGAAPKVMECVKRNYLKILKCFLIYIC